MNGEKREGVFDRAGASTQNLVRAFDLKGLYEVELYTDLMAGQVQKLTPVNERGVRDVSRFVRFFSSVTVSVGPRQFQVEFEIPAKSLDEAFRLFPDESTKAGMAFLERMESERLRSNLAGQTAAASVKPLVLPN